jgi:hypothetical protein
MSALRNAASDDSAVVEALNILIPMMSKVQDQVSDMVADMGVIKGGFTQFSKGCDERHRKLETRMDDIEDTVKPIERFKERATFIPVLVLFFLAVLGGIGETFNLLKSWLTGIK